MGSGCPLPVRGCKDNSGSSSFNFFNATELDFFHFLIVFWASFEKATEYIIKNLST